MAVMLAGLIDVIMLFYVALNGYFCDGELQLKT
ncbi:Uncharacterised protein [Yersinia frederiksenii]|uniref:Uncharacterized protein n=2 Tax=Yersinia frederiksenii TaxID=29484 RepID=A0A380Q1W8_YERFR|nr:putative membrane protein [Yersinia frederiksenii ATCC 33641]SUP79257.1 Uncharacterised protein [Yersinia frederiksenii]